jgi:hypothetical protein
MGRLGPARQLTGNFMSKRKDMQRLIRKYREETGEHELDMKRVAKWAAGKGWPLPTPPNPLDMLAKEFTDAAREEIEYDNKTGKPFRVYHALKVSHGGTQLHLFVDIEEASRDQMLVSLTMRREQMVSDGVMVIHDQDHWNAQHPTEKPIQMEMDLAFDIELRNHADDEEGPPGGGGAAG